MNELNKNWFPNLEPKKPSQKFISLMEASLQKSFYKHFGEPDDWDLFYPLIWPMQSLSLQPAPGLNKEGVMLYSLLLTFGNVSFRGIVSWYSKKKPRLYHIDETIFPKDLKIILWDTFFDFEKLFTGEAYNHNAKKVPERMLIKRIRQHVSYPLYYQGEFDPIRSKNPICSFVMHSFIDTDTIAFNIKKAINSTINNKDLQTDGFQNIIENLSEIKSTKNAFRMELKIPEKFYLPLFIKSLGSIGLPFKVLLFSESAVVELRNKPKNLKSQSNMKAQKDFKWLSWVISCFNFSYNFSRIMDDQLRIQLNKYSEGRLKYGNNTLFGIGIERAHMKKNTEKNGRKTCCITHYLNIGHGIPKIRLAVKWFSDSSDSYIDGQSEILPDDLKFEVVQIGNKGDLKEGILEYFKKQDLVKWDMNTYFSIYKEKNLDGSEGYIKILADQDIDPKEIFETLIEIVHSWNKNSKKEGKPFFKNISFDKKERNELYFSYDAGIATGSHKFIMEELSKKMQGIRAVYWLN